MSDALTSHARQTTWRPAGRTITTATGITLGVMHSPQLAEAVVEAHNRAVVEQAEREAM